MSKSLSIPIFECAFITLCRRGSRRRFEHWLGNEFTKVDYLVVGESLKSSLQLSMIKNITYFLNSDIIT